MKVNFDTVILDLKKEPVKDGDKELTLGAVIAAVMLMNLQDDTNLKGPEKVRMFRLAEQGVDGGEGEITTEDASLIKARVAKTQGALITARVYDAIEG